MIIDRYLIIVWAMINIAFFVPIFYLVKNKLMSQWMSTTAATLLAIAIYLAVESIYSYPKPFELEMWPEEQYTVIAVKVRPGEALYMYVDDGSGTPRSYSFKWSPEVSKLVNALRVARARNRATGNRGKVYYDPSLGSDGVSLNYPEIEEPYKAPGGYR